MYETKEKNQSNLETLKPKANVFEVHVSCRFTMYYSAFTWMYFKNIIPIFLDFHSPCKAKSLLHVSIIQWMHIAFVCMNDNE